MLHRVHQLAVVLPLARQLLPDEPLRTVLLLSSNAATRNPTESWSDSVISAFCVTFTGNKGHVIVVVVPSCHLGKEDPWL